MRIEKTIYVIRDLKNDKPIYFGATEDFENYSYQIKNKLETQKHTNKQLTQYVAEVGLDNIAIEIAVPQSIINDNDIAYAFALANQDTCFNILNRKNNDVIKTIESTIKALDRDYDYYYSHLSQCVEVLNESGVGALIDYNDYLYKRFKDNDLEFAIADSFIYQKPYNDDGSFNYETGNEFFYRTEEEKEIVLNNLLEEIDKRKERFNKSLMIEQAKIDFIKNI